MDASQLRIEFEKQIKDADTKITAAETNLRQLQDYKTKLQYKDEMIDLVKPQWYENKYLWFGFGVIFTAGSVHLAGQIN